VTIAAMVVVLADRNQQAGEALSLHLRRLVHLALTFLPY